MATSPSEGRIKVLLVGNYLPDDQQSMQRYAILLECLLSTKCDIQLIRPKDIFGALRFLPRSILKWLGYVDKYLVFPLVLIAAARAFDVVHICDQANAMYVWMLKGKPHIVTCHDVTEIKSALGLDPDHRPGWTGRLYHRLNLRGLAAATRIICVSNATRRELLSLTNIADNRVVMIMNCMNYPYSPMNATEASHRLKKFRILPNSKFILNVSGNVWYKNRLGLLRIFSALRVRAPERSLMLIIAGKPSTLELKREIERLHLNDYVIFTPDIENEDLRALYSVAQALVFPSLQEGFGWPIIEAQACGCPVAASKAGPLPEVGGAAAKYFDPKDEIMAADIILDVLSDRHTITAAGFINAARFSAATLTNDYYREYQTSVQQGLITKCNAATDHQHDHIT